jgi:hypothetical protein
MFNKDYYILLQMLETISKIGKYTKILLISFVIFLVFDSCQRPVHDTITESDVYNFLNEVIPVLMVNEDNSAIKETPIINIEREGESAQENIKAIRKTLKDYFKNGWIERRDVDYILSQQYDTTFNFKQNLLEEKLITKNLMDSIASTSGDLYFTLHDALKINGFCRISKPFFTIYKQTVIIVFEVYRNYLNANGYIVIFKKIDDKWIEYQKIETWIS